MRTESLPAVAPVSGGFLENLTAAAPHLTRYVLLLLGCIALGVGIVFGILPGLALAAGLGVAAFALLLALTIASLVSENQARELANREAARDNQIRRRVIFQQIYVTGDHNFVSGGNQTPVVSHVMGETRAINGVPVPMFRAIVRRAYEIGLSRRTWEGELVEGHPVPPAVLNQVIHALEGKNQVVGRGPRRPGYLLSSPRDTLAVFGITDEP